MQKKKYYQLFLIGALVLDIVVSVLYYIWYLDRKIPTDINIVANSEQSFDFNLPVKCESGNGWYDESDSGKKLWKLQSRT